jgi:hypothetical protein
MSSKETFQGIKELMHLKLLSNEIGFSSHLFLNRVCTDQGDIVGREYIHDSKKGVMRALVWPKIQ